MKLLKFLLTTRPFSFKIYTRHPEDFSLPLQSYFVIHKSNIGFIFSRQKKINISSYKSRNAIPKIVFLFIRFRGKPAKIFFLNILCKTTYHNDTFFFKDREIIWKSNIIYTALECSYIIYYPYGELHLPLLRGP